MHLTRSSTADDAAPLLGASSGARYGATQSEPGAAPAASPSSGQVASSLAAVPAADVTRVRFVGNRCLIRDGSAVIDWQSTILLRLRRVAADAAPCALMVDMVGGLNTFNCLASGRVHSAVQTARRARQTYTLPIGHSAAAAGMPVHAEGEGGFDVQLVKRTEPAIGQLLPPAKTEAAQLFGFSAARGWELAPLVPPPPTQRRIEFLGDSDLAAYGLEGSPTTMGLCGVLGLRNRYQNITNSWAHLLARMLDAEPCVVAWSGVGVHQNAAMSGDTPMGELYARAIATDDSPAALHNDFGEDARWSPQLVIVQVGGNDLYGGKTPPSEAAWVGSYVELLRSVREKRPTAVILNLIYSLETPSYDAAGARDGTLTRYTETAVSRFVAEQAGAGQQQQPAAVLVEAPPSGQRWPEDGGSLEHWGRDGHLKYAEAVCAAIETRLPQLGWKRTMREPRALEWIEYPPSL